MKTTESIITLKAKGVPVVCIRRTEQKWFNLDISLVNQSNKLFYLISILENKLSVANFIGSNYNEVNREASNYVENCMKTFSKHGLGSLLNFECPRCLKTWTKYSTLPDTMDNCSCGLNNLPNR